MQLFEGFDIILNEKLFKKFHKRIKNQGGKVFLVSKYKINKRDHTNKLIFFVECTHPTCKLPVGEMWLEDSLTMEQIQDPGPYIMIQHERVDQDFDPVFRDQLLYETSDDFGLVERILTEPEDEHLKDVLKNKKWNPNMDEILRAYHVMIQDPALSLQADALRVATGKTLQECQNRLRYLERVNKLAIVNTQ